MTALHSFMRTARFLKSPALWLTADCFSRHHGLLFRSSQSPRTKRPGRAVLVAAVSLTERPLELLPLLFLGLGCSIKPPTDPQAQLTDASDRPRFLLPLCLSHTSGAVGMVTSAALPGANAVSVL